MLNIKLTFTLFLSLSSLCLSAWTLTHNPKQQTLFFFPDKNEEKNECEGLRKRKCKHSQCTFFTHQKNRLNAFFEEDGFIWFDDENNKYTYFLSTFYPVSIKIWGMKFYSAEAALQAAKFLDRKELVVRFTHLTGADAIKFAQKNCDQQRGDWYKIRENTMLEILKAKFQQHHELKDLLLATGDAYLVENSKRDLFWSDGGSGEGKNRIGHLLMQVRKELGGTGEVPQPPRYKKFVSTPR